ncbi:methyltransferase family protein [Aspergillus mulundensis]|uniref:Protein-S-isoprenylcysteine O-methyltransferase n=1 Tax=Aspergillus mulundensis TaxID=1810919 RepID=A0A3D8RYR5_9EURO|nr:Uncharacterized protein DSM5745_05823 [Aspergillus mulundensis]RDW78971.1 Uncharacterized protein DSM5745_05823 [Aspergillus mulundensis]
MPSFSSAALALTLAVAGYLHDRCMTPPNTTTTPHTTDRVRIILSPQNLYLARITNVALIYHILVTLFSTPSQSDQATLAKLCPFPSHLDHSTVSWSARTTGYLALVGVGAFLRLGAYARLGRNFTYELAKPDRLTTSGIYRYLQHPSYTGMALELAGYCGLLVNWVDTPIACLVPGALLGLVREWEGAFLVLGSTVFCAFFSVRIRDEEMMLRERFGAEWEVWHGKTARVIPWVF